MAFIVRKPSDWQFYTSSTGGIGVEFVAAEGGQIWLISPGGYYVNYYYGGIGAGLSYGFKLPKIGKQMLKVKGKGVVSTVAPSSFTNGGKLYILDTFSGDELSASDMQGACMFVELAGGVIAGGSATAMILGMNPVWLGALLAMPTVPNPFFMTKLAQSAKAILVMAGVNAGIQANIGGAAYVGGLW